MNDLFWYCKLTTMKGKQAYQLVNIVVGMPCGINVYMWLDHKSDIG